eukprot:scaffold85650_cov21-Tisochrysis_lutea.AAC.3
MYTDRTKHSPADTAAAAHSAAPLGHRCLKSGAATPAARTHAPAVRPQAAAGAAAAAPAAAVGVPAGGAK